MPMRTPTYGYNGYYVDPEDYRYYFREGFQSWIRRMAITTSISMATTQMARMAFSATSLSLILNLQSLRRETTIHAFPAPG